MTVTKKHFGIEAREVLERDLAILDALPQPDAVALDDLRPVAVTAHPEGISPPGPAVDPHRVPVLVRAVQGRAERGVVPHVGDACHDAPPCR